MVAMTEAPFGFLTEKRLSVLYHHAQLSVGLRGSGWMSPKVRGVLFCGVLSAALAVVPLSAVAEEIEAAGARASETAVLVPQDGSSDASQLTIAAAATTPVVKTGEDNQSEANVAQQSSVSDEVKPAKEADSSTGLVNGESAPGTETGNDKNETAVTDVDSKTTADASAGSLDSAAEDASETPSDETDPVDNTASESDVPAQNVYRLYNPYSGEHLYTAGLDEAKGLVGYGWAWEGVGWVSPTSTGNPVLRLYNPYNGEHLYTLSEDEASGLASLGWRREGTAWLSGGSLGVLREFNPYATVGTHNYTLSSAEDEWLGTIGWRREGSTWSSLNRASLEVTPFWATGPSGRWWVQRNGSFASGRVVEPNEDGNPGIRAYATSSNGHVVRGVEAVGNRTIVADAKTGALPSVEGWWKSSAPTGCDQWYMMAKGSDGVPYAKTGRFEDGGSAYYGIPGEGHILVGRLRSGNGYLLTNGSGQLFESPGFSWIQAAGDPGVSLYRIGGYCAGGLVGARADGMFSDGDNRFYADPSSGRIRTSSVFYANGSWWRAVDWGGCFSAGSWQDMAAKAQNYWSATNYLILVDCTSNRTAVYQWDNGWYAIHEWYCTTGANNCTMKGQYTTNLKGYSFGSGFTCYYYTQFYGNYLFHSVLYYQNSDRIMDGRLGINASHGCVRLDINNAKWIYDNIPRGTKVVTY